MLLTMGITHQIFDVLHFIMKSIHVMHRRTFSTLTTLSYGNCFIFNFDNDTGSSRSVSLPGPEYGLTLVLNLEQEQYGTINEAAGAR